MIGMYLLLHCITVILNWKVLEQNDKVIRKELRWLLKFNSLKINTINNVFKTLITLI